MICGQPVVYDTNPPYDPLLDPILLDGEEYDPYCELEAGEHTMRWRSLSQGGEGELMTAALTVLPASPEAPQPKRSPLGMWAYRTVSEGVSDVEQTQQQIVDVVRRLEDAGEINPHVGEEEEQFIQ